MQYIPMVEGTKKDTGFVSLNHVDSEACSGCGGITYNIPDDRISLCAHCGSELSPCAGCANSPHADVGSSCVMRY